MYGKKINKFRQRKSLFSKIRTKSGVSEILQHITSSMFIFSTTSLVTFYWTTVKKEMENVHFWNKNVLTRIGEINKTTLNNPKHIILGK